MTAIDSVITGGLVADAHTVRHADVLINSGLIAGIVEPGMGRRIAAESIIDAQDCYVIPGGVDAHVHFNFGLAPLMSQGYSRGSKAALWGGTTTIVDFAFRAPGGGAPHLAAQAKLEEMSGSVSCDYGLHLILAGPISSQDLADLNKVTSAGIMSVKLFMNFPEFYPGDGAAYALFRRLAELGGTAVVHAENADIITHISKELIAQGHSDYRYADDSRPDWSEAEAVHRAIVLAAAARVPLFVLHITSAAALDEVRRAQNQGQRVYAETCHNYLTFTKHDVATRPDGANWGNFPPLRQQHDQEALWAGLKKHEICHVSTDDFTNDIANRNSVGATLPRIPAGHNGVETRMRVVFTEAVSKRHMTIQDYVWMTSTGIASELGLYPKKGSLEVGADADLVILDTSMKSLLRLQDLHTADYSIWDGYESAMQIRATMLRGQLMVREGEFVGPEGAGKYLPRTRLAPP